MSKEMENKLVPKLRFPEFIGSKAWYENELGRIGEFIGGGTPDTSIQEYWNGSILWYTPTEIKGRTLNKSIRSITEKGLKNSSAKILPKGTLLITTRATIGDIGIAETECTTNQGFQSLMVNQNQINTFWYYWIVRHKSELQRRSSGSTFLEIGKNEISRIKALYPHKEEQQKIADCLSSLDDLIAAEREKLDALKDHKKGLMQQIFPAEGEKVPKLRFAEFENNGDWEEKRLDKLCQINPTISKLPDQFIYIDLESVDNGVLNKNQIITLNGAPSRAQRLLANKDVIFQTVRPYQKNNYYFIEDGNNAYVASTGYAQLRAFQSSDFLFQIIHTDRFVANVLTKCTGSNYPAINSSDLSSIVVQVPTSQIEQQKIADCLFSLDEQINKQTQKIEELKTHKKGLLQQLFPNTN